MSNDQYLFSYFTYNSTCIQPAQVSHCESVSHIVTDVSDKYTPKKQYFCTPVVALSTINVKNDFWECKHCWFDQHAAKRLITQGIQQSKHHYASIIRHKLCTKTWKIVSENTMRRINVVVSQVVDPTSHKLPSVCLWLASGGDTCSMLVLV